jgi:SRSO17 transposase
VISYPSVTLPQFERKQGQLRAALKGAVARLAPHFPNPAARATAAAYLQSLLSPVERKNSWQLAEAAGLANPYAFQHLLGRAHWEADAVRDAHFQAVLAGLGQADAVLAIDETAFIKKGHKSVGVARQYCGASGKLDNGQVGVFLSWQTAKGHALLDRALYLPREWTEDPPRCRAAGIPEEVTFAAKPELARRLVERALEAGARPAWVVADAVYGADSKLRFFLEERQQPYVMAVTSAQSVWTGLTQRRVKSLVALAPADAWQRLKVGAGTKGPRLFDWAAVAINHPYEPQSWQRWVLLRRSCSDPEDIAFYLAFGPADTPVSELARAAGRRWAIEEAFAQAKGEVGLDHYEVRSWVGWHRHMTLAMAAHALLTLTRTQLFVPATPPAPTLADFKKKRGLVPVVSVDW